jgi:hypothetical protein
MKKQGSSYCSNESIEILKTQQDNLRGSSGGVGGGGC